MTEPYEYEVLMRVLVGSMAHGTDRPDSDFDYREVFVIPTSTQLAIGRPKLKFAWQHESRHTDDEGGHEIAQFLHLCSKGAPNVVEMLFAPNDEVTSRTGYEKQVRKAGRSVLSRTAVQKGVIGYAMNSFRKIDSAPGKWKGGMLRVLYQGRDLIQIGNMSLTVPLDGWGLHVRDALLNVPTDGQALDRANKIIKQIENGPSVLPDEPDFTEANEWLLKTRRKFWDA